MATIVAEDVLETFCLSGSFSHTGRLCRDGWLEMVDAAEASAVRSISKENDKGESWWHRFGSATTAVVTVIAAIVAVAASSVDVLYAVDPNSRPVDEMSVILERIAIQQGITYNDFLPRKAGYGGQQVGILRNGDAHFPQPPFDEKGIVVIVKADVRGMSDSLYSATAEVLEASSDSSYPYDEEKESLLVSTCDVKMATFRAAGLTFRCWLHNPSVGTKYRVRVKLYANDKILTIDHDESRLVDFIETPNVTCCGTDPKKSPAPKVSITP
ncbi:hypothetical protein N5079_17190 [Planotetraspora sp. A-T 1434]|uniref:hypothetical protein n=1 Tax=Planotetraspora sp. A-T 1434 TaxID=2979219 RepID=UPI0021C1614C|nr:hypothetical protein [Planotetraspora sp. A-T 1434]MCT9931941.1 hypothetical protein [Planotetraspora sp. A-T 1434]